MNHLHKDSNNKETEPQVQNTYWFDSSKMDYLEEPIKNDYEPYEDTQVVDKMQGNLMQSEELAVPQRSSSLED